MIEMGEKIEFKRWKDAAEVVKAAEETVKIGDKYLQYASSDKNEDKVQAGKSGSSSRINTGTSCMPSWTLRPSLFPKF